MKRAILFSLLFLFAVFNGFLNPAMKQAEAITTVYLISPSDSVKMMEPTPTFEWGSVRDPAFRETILRYHIAVAEDFNLTVPVWGDTIVHPTKSKDYDGDPFEEWKTYFWSVKVEVEVMTIDASDTTFDTLWYNFVPSRTFFYTTATLIEIPDSLPTIQAGIIWAGEGDTVLVKPGTYYENLRFYKKRVILASHFARDTTNTAIIDSTIIDGDSLTRGEERGSVIYFTSEADSNSWVIGFTIRNGIGTKATVGIEEKFNGGGIFCELGSMPTIAYNVITQNQVEGDGGGIFCYTAAPNIFNNIITQNSAGGSGGAIQCYYSIRIRPPASPSPPGGEGGEDEEVELMPKTPPPARSTELNSTTEEEDLENSLYPRDATEVFSALSSDPLAKSAQSPPEAILEYYVRRDTVVEREKILVGDTIVLDGSASYDSDGDSIRMYKWRGYRWQRCESPDDTSNYNLPSGGTQSSHEIPVTAGFGGLYQIWLIAETGPGPGNADTSDTVYLNIQRSPRADAGDTVGVAPGDTARLDGSGSCDINPEDITLTYDWTQILGYPVTLADTTVIIDTIIVDSDTTIDTTIYLYPFNPYPYFETKDSAYYLGEYQFQLQVCDPDVDTLIDNTTTPPDTIITGCSMDTSVVMCSNRPVAVSSTDSLFGYVVGDSVLLDGSLSWDPDSALGDYVRYFIWEYLSRTTCEDTLELFDTVAFAEQETSIWYPSRGGVHTLSLLVRDSYGIKSENTDTLIISVQLPPKPDAGPDTVIIPGTKAYLHGSACELNWDQVSSLKYKWFVIEGQNPVTVVLFDSLSNQNEDVPNVWFITGTSGVFHFYLRVIDSLQASLPDDTVRVIVNELPEARITRPAGDDRFAEGDTVELDASESSDPDADVFGDSLTFNWSAINWPGYPDNTYQPTLVNPAEAIAKFAPLKHGEYEFEVVVHDTISPNQDPSLDPDFNVKTVTVKVDTTFAHPIITGNLIWFNTAGLKGGGIDCFQSSPQVINNIFYKNKSGSSGGAVCVRFLSAPFIERNIFFGNISSDSTGGGIADLKAEFSPAASIGFRWKTVVTTNDFWNNPGGDLYQPPADVFDNIYLYPRLIDPEYGNFRLECSSPCLADSIGLLLWLYPDTCDTVPALGMISLSLFQHPVATAVAHFLVNTDVALKAPPVGYVTIGENSPAPVDFTSISSTTYRGKFVFTTSGTAHISIFASSIHEVPDTLTRDFTVQLIGGGKIGRLVSHDNRLKVLFPQGAVKAEIYATCIPVSDDSKYSFEDEEKVALGEAYHLGPLSDFKKELTISFPLDDYNLTEKDRTLFSIYRYEKNGWEKQASFLDENSICARVRSLGAYRLVYDAKQERITGIPKTYQLFQNYPNPFNPQTMIKYDLPNPGHVNITVYNILGQKVKTLADGHQEAGHKSVNWDGRDDRGNEVASGIYFYKIKAVEFEKTKKMVFLK